MKLLSAIGMVLSTLTLSSTAVNAQQGPGCPRLMNIKACAACAEKYNPGRWSQVGRERWCAEMIANRKARGKGKAKLRY